MSSPIFSSFLFLFFALFLFFVEKTAQASTQSAYQPTLRATFATFACSQTNAERPTAPLTTPTHSPTHRIKEEAIVHANNEKINTTNLPVSRSDGPSIDPAAPRAAEEKKSPTHCLHPPHASIAIPARILPTIIDMCLRSCGLELLNFCFVVPRT